MPISLMPNYYLQLCKTIIRVVIQCYLGIIYITGVTIYLIDGNVCITDSSDVHDKSLCFCS
jgi:hypothetical protein